MQASPLSCQDPVQQVNDSITKLQNLLDSSIKQYETKWDELYTKNMNDSQERVKFAKETVERVFKNAISNIDVLFTNTQMLTGIEESPCTNKTMSAILVSKNVALESMDNCSIILKNALLQAITDKDGAISTMMDIVTKRRNELEACDLSKFCIVELDSTIQNDIGANVFDMTISNIYDDFVSTNGRETYNNVRCVNEVVEKFTSDMNVTLKSFETCNYNLHLSVK